MLTTGRQSTLLARTLRGIWGPVCEHNPQVAVAAEHEAVTFGALHSRASTFVTDCQAVANEWEAGWKSATKYTRVYAGYWRQCGRHKPFDNVCKTKAHVEVAANPTTKEI